MTATIPPVSVTRIPQLLERGDGIWTFTGGEFDDHVRIWNDIDAKVNSAQWAMAAIACSVTVKFGDGVIGESGVEEFAKRVKRTPQYIWKMARTYHTFVTDYPQGYSADLSFSHHVRAVSHSDPVEAIEAAKAGDLSAIGLEEWVTGQAKERIKKNKKNPPKEGDADFHAYLEHVEEVILDDFLGPRCPNVQWARRLFDNVLQEIRYENRQLYLSESQDKINAAINDGAMTIPEIRAKTNLPMRDVENLVKKMVAEGPWEWVREGGEPDAARGTRRSILHRVGEPVFV